MNLKRLEQVLAENMLRFGVKNLSDINRDQLRVIVEQTGIDWTRGGKIKKFEDADLDDMIAYIRAQDTGKPFTSIPVYQPMIQWFEKNGKKKKSASIKKSLSNWAGADQTKSALTKVAGVTAAATGMGLQSPAAQQAVSASTGTAAKNMDYTNYINPVKKALELATSKNHIKLRADLQTYLNWLNAQQGKISKSTIFTQWMDKIQATLAKYTGVADITFKPTFLKVQKEYEKLLKKNQLGATTDGMNDGQRTVLMTKLLQQVQSKQRSKPRFFDGIVGKDASIENIVMAADGITIGKGTTAVNIQTAAGETIEANTQPKQTAVWAFQYPPKDIAGTQQGAGLAQTMFGDDKSVMSADVKSAIVTEMQKMDAEFTKLKETIKGKGSLGEYEFKIVSVEFRSVSSTSTVNSAYDGIALASSMDKGSLKTDPATGKFTTGTIGGKPMEVGKEKPQRRDDFSDKRNIPLAKDRVAEMNKVLRDEFNKTSIGRQANLPGSKTLKTDSNWEYPNNGPTWSKKVGGIDKFSNAQLGISAYGPLFQEAYKRMRGNLTARQFYGARNATAARNATNYLGKAVTEQQLVNEYEATYSKYRTSAVGISLVVEMLPIDTAAATEPTQEFAVSTAGSFTISIYWDSFTWNDIKRNLPDIRFKSGKTGGGFSGKVPPKLTLGCPLWD